MFDCELVMKAVFSEAAALDEFTAAPTAQTTSAESKSSLYHRQGYSSRKNNSPPSHKKDHRKVHLLDDGTTPKTPFLKWATTPLCRSNTVFTARTPIIHYAFPIRP